METAVLAELPDEALYHLLLVLLSRAGLEMAPSHG